MTTYLPRSAWNARPATGARLLQAAEVRGVAIHWPGMAKPLVTGSEVANAINGWQDYHMDGKGWSDIAYQVAVDQVGRAWTLRGLQTRSAANGDEDTNSYYGAILLVLAPGEHPSPAMISTTRSVVADFREIFPKATVIVPHSGIRPEPTVCPGDLARSAITRGAFNPSTTPKEDDMTPEQAAEMLALLRSIDTRLNGMNARVGVLANNMAPNVDRIADKYVGPN